MALVLTCHFVQVQNLVQLQIFVRYVAMVLDLGQNNVKEGIQDAELIVHVSRLTNQHLHHKGVVFVDVEMVFGIQQQSNVIAALEQQTVLVVLVVLPQCQMVMGSVFQNQRTIVGMV